MPRIHVCSLRALHPTVASIGARQVLTLIKNTGQVERPAGILPDRHLALDFSDIVTAKDGEVLASAPQVEALVEFAHRWDRETPLVVHCYAGVSRSTAGAFISACALRPDRPEQDWAADLRRASPTATPNLHLVTLADRLLERRGRMIAAIEAIGRGSDCFEGIPFHLDIGPRPGDGR